MWLWYDCCVLTLTGRLLVSLLVLIAEEPSDPRVAFVRESCPPGAFDESRMPCWAPGSAAAAHAAHSPAWLRARGFALAAEEEGASLAEAGVPVGEPACGSSR